MKTKHIVCILVAVVAIVLIYKFVIKKEKFSLGGLIGGGSARMVEHNICPAVGGGTVDCGRLPCANGGGCGERKVVGNAA